MPSDEPLALVRAGDAMFDAAAGAAWAAGPRVQLSPRLAALLRRLVSAAPRPVKPTWQLVIGQEPGYAGLACGRDARAPRSMLMPASVSVTVPVSVSVSVPVSVPVAVSEPRGPPAGDTPALPARY